MVFIRQAGKNDPGNGSRLFQAGNNGCGVTLVNWVIDRSSGDLSPNGPNFQGNPRFANAGIPST
ncbi:MAG: hypothetical protein Fues2KO_12910 [Fuerstiella sp.]